MAVHARSKNEFMEDEKYHNLMTWLKYLRQPMVKGYLYSQTANAPVSLRISAVLPEPSLLPNNI